jgi:hypothetical protein
LIRGLKGLDTFVWFVCRDFNVRVSGSRFLGGKDYGLRIPVRLEVDILDEVDHVTPRLICILVCDLKSVYAYIAVHFKADMRMV